MATSDSKEKCSKSADDNYFRSYSDLSVHELMIKDIPRTLAYKEFIEKNAHIVKDKVVLDVGAGTGILSLFAARSGAKKVYAVEASDIVDLCKEIVQVNKFQDIITVIRGEMEKIDLPEKVDIIISEWMGFYLLHESMLGSVLHARDCWLKDDGIILPSHAAIYSCPVNMTEYWLDNISVWEDVYDFNFSPVMHQKIAAHLQQPAVIHLKKNQMLAESVLVARYDLKCMTLHDIEEIDEQMEFVINKDADLHGFAVWFDVRFTPDLTAEQYGLTCLEKARLEGKEAECDGGEDVPNEKGDNSNKNKKTPQLEKLTNGCLVENCNDNDIVADWENSDSDSKLHHLTLSTSPLATETHWKQTVSFLPAVLTVKKSGKIYCRINLSMDTSNRRHYNISFEMLEGLEISDSEESLDDDEDDAEHHPVPCDCGSGRCVLIRAIMERYDAEQTELEMEAEFTDVSAEVQAAQTMDNEVSALETDSSLKDDSFLNSDKKDDAK